MLAISGINHSSSFERIFTTGRSLEGVPIFMKVAKIVIQVFFPLAALLFLAEVPKLYWRPLQKQLQC